MGKPDPSQIREMMAVAQGGDREAFDQVVRALQDRLAESVRARLGAHLKERLEVDDVLQETYARALQSIRRFEWRGDDSVYRWFSAIAEHVLLEAVRALEKSPRLRLRSDAPEDETSPSKAIRRQERFDRLKKALDSLSPDHREVITLSRLKRLKVEEIAQRMNRSRDAVKQLLSRGLKKLKESFGDTGSFGLPDRPLNSGGTEDDGRG